MVVANLRSDQAVAEACATGIRNTGGSASIYIGRRKIHRALLRSKVDVFERKELTARKVILLPHASFVGGRHAEARCAYAFAGVVASIGDADRVRAAPVRDPTDLIHCEPDNLPIPAGVSLEAIETEIAVGVHG
ncbi:hypothetical protein IEQ34_015492 [Dendrobium chrysotoxum]|uniref:Uncharacterized protein n=1 Tax=Dendrobium chrysotoxum TaxID=161865 RepID=A0AAV7G070_DENCH|nr:hypothetical protein IEQ34_015492 [Dendrobium chrysotoxum]